MTWNLRIARRAEKALEKLPADDQKRLLAAIATMRENPFAGDIVRLKNQPASWRRRVGSYRIFFDVYPDQRFVDVVEIKRRTSTTY